MSRYVPAYYEKPETPWCVLGKVTWGVAQAVKVPESHAPYYVGKHGWTVLIRDSEFPVAIDDAGTMPEITSEQSNPVRQQMPRHRYRVDADWWREDGA